MSDDSAARVLALDPGMSFGVRAPAGSGKTTLLTQRVLRLLQTVDHPEQVVAITFTRKAAEEMRARIVDALNLATDEPPGDDFLRQTWELAVAVRAHDEARDWRLAEHPARLRIMTIDALCQSLVRQMPVTARMPGLPTVEEDLQQLYREAAHGALAGIADGGSFRRSIARALQHFDNDWGKLEILVADMLAKRDQWLPQIGVGSDREVLELCYTRTVTDELVALHAELPSQLIGELTALIDFVNDNLDGSPFAGTSTFPRAVIADLPAWQALCRLFLTGAFEWRKRVDKRDGFPAGNADAKVMKQRWADALAALTEHGAVRSLMTRVLQLPCTAFGEGEWDTVSALLTVLKSATAHLIVLCEQGGRSDFTAFSMAALVALGEPEQPTDLALSLDYQIRHLLIDEFQDTSITQYELVKRLTAGWHDGDGRTLFLVGDPMQSIYRFRQAEVNLFLRVLQDGRIGSVGLESLTLSVNFRAQAGLVDWVNRAMPQALSTIAAPDDLFVEQTAVRAALPDPCVVHAFTRFDAKAEAERVRDIVVALRANDPAASIAVLVRSRTHIGQITSALIGVGITVAAREIKPFAELEVIADLTALARALMHDADRVAWFAVLRAPWCALTLNALYELAALAPSIPQALATAATNGGFSADEQARIARVHAIITDARSALRLHALSTVLEQTWLALGGPAVAGPIQALADARSFFSILDALERDGIPLTAGRISNRIRDRFSAPPPGDTDAVQIMTVHRAKGLEFDHVIVPGLGRAPRGDSRPMLIWREDIDSRGQPNLLLAPVPVKGKSALYEYLRARESTDANAEIARVLYVALTRARQQIHLLAHAQRTVDGSAGPAKGALLSLLWPMVRDDFEVACVTPAEHPAATPERIQLRRARLSTLPVYDPPPLQGATPPAGVEPLVDFDWAGLTAKHVGTVTHRLLQDLAGIKDARAIDEWQAGALSFARGQLRALGIAERDLGGALDMLRQALATTLASERGRWLFAAEHLEAQAELCLANVDERAIARVIIDRTFVDDSDRRWIIDFKTGIHSGGGREAYLDSEVLRYRPQLERYAHVMTARDPRPIMLGLYFPLLDGWREWPFVRS